MAEGSVGGKGDRQTENGEPSKKADGTGQEEEEEEGEPEEDPVWTDFSAEYYEGESAATFVSFSHQVALFIESLFKDGKNEN